MLFGVLTILAIPVGATVVDWSLSGNARVALVQSYLPWLSLLVWLGLLAMMSAFAFYGAKKIPLGPQEHIGWPNRFMVFVRPMACPDCGSNTLMAVRGKCGARLFRID